MAFRNRPQAVRRSIIAGLIGVTLLVLFGQEMAVPTVALVGLVYYGHQLVAAVAGDEEITHPGLALLIAVNSLVILAVQAIVITKGGFF